MTLPDEAVVEFAGFWPRVAASMIDWLLICVVIVPLLLTAYGAEYFESQAIVAGPLDFLLTWVFPAIATILFWIYKEATPGKMALGIRVVDEKSGTHAAPAKYVGRYFAYFVSTIPLCLGFIWVVWDARKQGWHDKLAGTVVVRRRRAPEVPTFRAPA